MLHHVSLCCSFSFLCAAMMFSKFNRNNIVTLYKIRMAKYCVAIKLLHASELVEAAAESEHGKRLNRVVKTCQYKYGTFFKKSFLNQFD